MPPNVIDYRQPDLRADLPKPDAPKLGIVSICIFFGLVVLAGLLALFGPGIYSNAWVFTEALVFCTAFLGTLWGARGVHQCRRCALAWIGFLLNLIFGLGGLSYFLLVQYVITQMET